MSRHPLLPARARRLIGAGVVGAGIFALALAGASAEEAAPRPAIDSAPRKAAFGKTVVIRGHVENGASGDQVLLQRSTKSGSWKGVRTAKVDDDLKVRFRLKGVFESAHYRLHYSGSDGALSASQTSASSGGVMVRVKPKLTVHVHPGRIMAGNKVRVEGALRPQQSGRRVTIKRKSAGDWQTVARPSVRDGRYSARFKAAHPSRSRVKVVFGGDAANTGARRKDNLVVYDPDLASWYGPGLYGNRTACGQTLGYDTLGVAHRTLPCGTKVGILYRGRSITVPVIDRGPYGSADWDLTRAAAARLRFSGHGTVGTIH
jgi:hypothetical protein